MENKPIRSFSGKFDFLSNFYPSTIEYEGVNYHTAEHAFQAAKVEAYTEKRKIRDAPTPGKAKWLGRKVQLVHNWEEIKLKVMLDLVRIKFKDPVLRKKLLNTGDQDLYEGNVWHDNFWGGCWCPDCLNVPKANVLGQILMRVRLEARRCEAET